jgi:hypothetical protein
VAGTGYNRGNEEMNLVKACIEGLAFGVAVASATFWLQATRINPPWAATDTMEGRPAPDVLQQLRRQSKLNAKAALFSGISGHPPMDRARDVVEPALRKISAEGADAP